MLVGIFFIYLGTFKSRSIIHKKGLFPSTINKSHRPMGLKYSEIKKIIKKISDLQINEQLKTAIKYRRIGFFLLILIPIVILFGEEHPTLTNGAIYPKK